MGERSEKGGGRRGYKDQGYYSTYGGRTRPLCAKRNDRRGGGILSKEGIKVILRKEGKRERERENRGRSWFSADNTETEKGKKFPSSSFPSFPSSFSRRWKLDGR